MAIAEAAGPEIAARARAAALAACGASDDESLGVKLLADIREAFEDARKDELPSKALVELWRRWPIGLGGSATMASPLLKIGWRGG